jgi:hypothetical protein
MLPDDILLEIFDFYVDKTYQIHAWQSLVHVCGRWRRFVFASPNRLNLRLVCTAKTPARDKLDLWPALPLLIRYAPLEESLDDIVAALELSDRVREICLTPFLMSGPNLARVSSSNMERLSAAMHVPFPELTDLRLTSYGEVVLPDSFLGGSGPRLRDLSLERTRFSGLPNLFLSATHLVNLTLSDIPHSGHISPGWWLLPFPP